MGNKSLEQVIKLLEEDVGGWVQGNYTLNNKEAGIRIWTANMPYLNCNIHEPKRHIGFIGGIRLQLAVNKWHREVGL